MKPVVIFMPLVLYKEPNSKNITGKLKNIVKAVLKNLMTDASVFTEQQLQVKLAGKWLGQG